MMFPAMMMSDNIAIASTENNPHSAISISESKLNLKEAATPSSATTTMLGQSSAMTTTTGNHLELPQQSNPNLLSPDVLNQRRGLYFKEV